MQILFNRCMADIRDVFVNSLPEIAKAIDQSEYSRGGKIATNIERLAVQLEYRYEAFVSNILNDTCFQLHQIAIIYDVPPSITGEINGGIAALITSLVTEYSNSKTSYEILQEILYTAMEFEVSAQQNFMPRPPQTTE